MKLNLIIAATLCCAVPAVTPVFAADAPAQTAQQKAEAEKKAKAEAEKKAREEAKANGDQANKFVGAFNQAFKDGKAEDAEAAAKGAFALFGKPGVQGLDWFVRSFGNHDFNRDKGDTRKLAIRLYAGNHRLLVSKAEGDAKVARMNALVGVLKLDKAANEKEIAQVLADRYKVPGVAKKTLAGMYANDCNFKEADAASEALLKEAPAGDAAALAKAFDDVLAAWETAGIFGCEAGQKWWDRAAKDVVRTGDAKWEFLNRYADHLEKYALVPMEAVDKIRAERDQIADLSLKRRFQNELGKMRGGETDEAYTQALTNALTLAGTNASMRLQVYERATLGGGWGWGDKIPCNYNAFLRDVVLKDPAATTGRGNRLGQYLSAYAKNGYADYEATEKYLRTWESVDAHAVRGALRDLWSVAGRRYYHGLDPAFAKKILATYQQDLYEFEAAKPLKDAWHYNNNVAGLRRKVADAAMSADEPLVVEEMLAALEKGEKPDRLYIACRRGELAFRAKDYVRCVAVLKPLVDDAALNNRWDVGFPAEALVRSLVAVGDVEEAARIMEKKIDSFPRWTRRNYFQPRLDALKARAAEIKKARESADK